MRIDHLSVINHELGKYRIYSRIIVMKYKRTDFTPERKRKYGIWYDIICEVILIN